MTRTGPDAVPGSSRFVPLQSFNEILGRPENERPFLVLVTGYPSPDAMVPRITKKPLSDIAAFVE